MAFRVLGGAGTAPLAAGRDWLWSLPMMKPTEVRERGSHDGSGHPELMDMLLNLDWKVSFIVKHLMSESRPDLFPHAGVMSEVSGGGMRLLTAQVVEAGNLIEVDVVLPVVPFHNLFVKGEVVQVRPAKGETESNILDVGVAFRDIKESQRDHLVKYALKRQMALQRERRAA